MAQYTCKQCGAELFFDPVSGKLHCEYCDTYYDPAEFDGTASENTQGSENAGSGTSSQAHSEAAGQTQGETSGETAWEGSTSTDESVGDLVIYHCKNCGAEIITAKETASTTCLYCNKALTLDGNLTGEFKPDYVIPFSKTKEDAEEAYRKLCRSSILTPATFVNRENIKKIKGMYVPFWLHSFKGDALISVKGKNIRHWTMGDTEYTEVTEYRVHEEVEGGFERIPTDAVVAMDNDMMDSIEPFDLSEMKPFTPGYLAGFYTQRWDDSASDNENRAKERARKGLISETTRRAGNYTQTTIENERIAWSEDKVESAMIPIWMMYTEYKGKNYVFGMNAQTGKLMGKIPKSASRILTIAGGTFVISQIIMMIIRVLGVVL